jgi:molecular chaperone IbpA
MTRLSEIAFGPGFRDFEKWFVGFDDQFDRLNKIAAAAQRNTSSYPPHNVVKTGEFTYKIELAVAGFSDSDLNIEYAENNLTVSGNIQTDETTEIIHQGIANRAFSRTFGLPDDVEVTGSELKNGLLSIYLERIIPEHKKPRTITIGSVPAVESKTQKQLLTENKK